MARTHGGSALTGRKITLAHSLQSRVSSKRSRNWLSTVAAAPSTGIPLGIDFSLSLTYSIPSLIYGFLRSLNVRFASLNPATIPTVNPITRWELFVYEPPRIELVTGGISTESVESSSDLRLVWVLRILFLLVFSLKTVMMMKRLYGPKEP